MEIEQKRKVVKVIMGSESKESEYEKIQGIRYNIVLFNNGTPGIPIEGYDFVKVEEVIRQIEAKEQEYYTDNTGVYAPVKVGKTENETKYIYSKPNDSTEDNLLTIAHKDS